jgi:amino acid transporter
MTGNTPPLGGGVCVSRDPGCRGALFRRVNRDRVPFNAVAAVSVASLVIAIPALFGKNNIPFAFFVLTGICTVGFYSPTSSRVLRLRRGEAFESAPWNLGRRYRLVNTLAILFEISVVYSLNLPYTPGWPAVERRLRREPRQLHAARDRAAADLRRVAPRVSQGPLPGPGADARGRRGHGRRVTTAGADDAVPAG